MLPEQENYNVTLISHQSDCYGYCCAKLSQLSSYTSLLTKTRVYHHVYYRLILHRELQCTSYKVQRTMPNLTTHDPPTHMHAIVLHPLLNSPIKTSVNRSPVLTLLGSVCEKILILLHL